jgi:hypothetical protein
MSMPISSCLVSKAAFGNEEAYESLVKAFEINLECGHHTQFPCRCEPSCPTPTEDQLAALQKKLDDHFEKNPVERYVCPNGVQGTQGFQGPVEDK